MQLEIDHPTDIIFEWIPYNQFEDIKEIRKGNLATATWKDGSLYWNSKNKEYLRYSDEIITLKYFDSEEFENERLLNKVLNEYSIKESKISKIYGISQDPITKDYLLILYNNYLKKFCIECGEQYTDINMNCKNKEYIRNSDEIVVLEYFDGEKFYSFNKIFNKGIQH
ncbi:kinase-like domain-containing protein [Rhizophagus irregularis DAOM 181602=DAOM 197198]|nr:kinase-like domain-containing protein [Rhizophagus irregularis DAOM 181602=DAOM 197198]